MAQAQPKLTIDPSFGSSYCRSKNHAVPQVQLQSLMQEKCDTRKPFNVSWVSSKTVAFCCIQK